MSTPDVMTIGQRLRTARLARGLSQAQLARAAGLSSQAVNQIERGVHPAPRFTTIAALARVLDVTPSWLVSTDPDAPGRP